MGGGPSKRYNFDRSIEDYLKKDKGRELWIYNFTGHDVVMATYKVHTVFCTTGDCPIDQTIRTSPYVFIGADEEKKRLLRYKPMGISERILPGMKEYLYWSYAPEVVKGESKHSLVALGLELRSATKKQPVDQKRIIEIANKYWPTMRDYYVETDEGGNEGFLANTARPMVQQSVNDLLLPTKLERVDRAVLVETKRKPRDYRNLRIAEVNGITRLRLNNSINALYLSPIKKSRFTKSESLEFTQKELERQQKEKEIREKEILDEIRQRIAQIKSNQQKQQQPKKTGGNAPTSRQLNKHIIGRTLRPIIRRPRFIYHM